MKKQKKRWIKPASALLAAALLAGVPARAAETQPEPDQRQLAQMLYDLQLFRGTDQGFELERTMTRAEAAVLVTRFFGGEQQALEQNQPSPFQDAPDWAAPYVGWLYQKGLTKGISETQYGGQRQITFNQFAVMLNRRLSPETSYEQCAAYGCQIASQDQMAQGERPILRGEAAELAANSLGCITEKESQTLAQALLGEGLFTLEQWEKAAAPLWGYDYVDVPAEGRPGEYRIEKRVLGATVGGSQPLPGQPIRLGSLEGGQLLYTVRQGEQISLYALDEQTMDLRPIDRPLEGRYAWEWGAQGGFCYFALETAGGDLAFYRTDGQAVQLVQDQGLVFTLSKDPKFNGTYRLRQLPQGLFLCCPEGLYRVNQAGDGLEQLVGGVAVRDAVSQGQGIYYTTFDLRQTESGWVQQDGGQILLLDEQGAISTAFDGQALGLHPSRLSKIEDGKLYFSAEDQARHSPKGEVSFTYCWDGKRVSVSQCLAEGAEAAGLTGEEWARREQLRLDEEQGQ